MLYCRVGGFGESCFVGLGFSHGGFSKCRVIVLESLARVVLSG